MADQNLENVIKSGNYSTADIRLVFIGKTGVGKSSSCNSFLGRAAMNASVGASSVTQECRQEVTQRGGRTIQVVDTPGFFDTQIDNEISSKITQCVALSAPGPHAIILVIRVGRFTEEDRTTVEQIKKWFGEDMVRNMIVVFTGEDDLEADHVAVADFLANSPDSLKQLLVQANNRYLTVNNRASDEKKAKFSLDLLALVDEVVKMNNGSWYTTERFRKAQEEVKRKEEEEAERKREALKRQRDEIEETIKSKYAKMLSDQDQQLQKLAQEMSSLQVLGQQNNVQYDDKVKELNQKLAQAQQQRHQMATEREQWEKNLLDQTNKNEIERSNALKALKYKIDMSITEKEEEVRQFASRIESERVSREQEINRRAEEKRRQEQEEHNRRMAALEAERRQQEENMRLEQQRQADLLAQMEQQRQQAEAEARRRRHRHRHHGLRKIVHSLKW